MIRYITEKSIHQLDSLKNFFIYGTGKKGKLLFQLIKSNKLSEKFGGFINSFFSGEYNSHPIFKVDQIEEHIKNSQKILIIIASYASEEIIKTLYENNISNFIIFMSPEEKINDNWKQMEAHWEKITTCNLLFFKYGELIEDFQDIPHNLKIILILNGYQTDELDVLGLKAIIENSSTCSIVNILYTGELSIGKAAKLAHNSIAFDAFLLCPVFSQTLSGSLSALTFIDEAYPEKKLYILDDQPVRQRQCVVVDELKLIFMPIPKCGSTSLLTSVRNIKGNVFFETPHDGEGINSNYYALDIADKKYENYFKFTIVRNPFARIVSFFKTNEQAKYLPYQFKKAINKNMNFSNFCDFVFQSPDLFSDEHYRSQHLFVFGKSNHHPFDYIGKLETLAEDLNRIHRITGIHIPVPHLNKSGAGNTYKNYFSDPSLAHLIKKRYKKDFKLFEYDLA